MIPDLGKTGDSAPLQDCQYYVVNITVYRKLCKKKYEADSQGYGNGGRQGKTGVIEIDRHAELLYIPCTVK